VNQSAKLLKDYAIDGVPTVVVQGKYNTGPAYTNSIPGTAQVLDFLVKQVQDKKL
jgi:thiol:disulfide interchange protein DsbA